MAANPSMRRALLPALMLAVPPLLLLMSLQLIQPALLATPWSWLLAFMLIAVGISMFGRYLYRRAVLVGEQLLAAGRGEVGADPFDGDPHGPVQRALAYILERHRRSERALRASEQRFQLALEASDAHLWEHCLKSGRLTFDTSIGRMFLEDQMPLEKEPHSVDTHSVDTEVPLKRFIGIIHPDDLPRLQHSSEEFFRSGEFTCEYRCRHRERGYIWMRCRGRVMERAEDGTPLRALGTMTDISDLKQIEERLQAALITAQDANHARAQFFAGISHELRTPLNGVLGYTQLLLRDAVVDSEPRSHLQAIERCGQHLLRLINDIIDLAQIDSGRVDLHEAECDLPVLLDNVGHVARQQAEARQLQFSLELDPQLPPLVLLDGIKLRQILSNLLNNAVKFTERGVVTLKVRAVAGAAPVLQFEVQDTGIGIAAERLAQLFEPFGRPGESDDSGFGLAVSQRLCELMGGQITVSSAPGAGSCFRFALPCRRIDAWSSATAPLSPVAMAGPPATAVAGEPLRQLPESALVPLRSALALGDLEGLRSALAALRQRVPAAQSLIDHCNALLEGFELERIRELLEDLPGNV